MAVKSKPITTVADARLVSKSFALKFLRKAFIGARIQRVETPRGTKIPPEVEGLGPIETWQVWASSPKGKQGVVEVTAPRDMLPYAAVREAYRCRLQMDVVVSQIKGGVNLTATPFPPPEKPAVSEEAIKAAAHHSADPEAVQAALDAEEPSENLKEAITSYQTAHPGETIPLVEERPAVRYVAGLSAEERAKIRKAAAKSGTTVVFEDEQMEAGHA